MDRGVVELGPAPPAPLMTSQQQLSRVAQDTCATRSEGVAGLDLGSVSPLHNQSAARHLHGRPC